MRTPLPSSLAASLFAATIVLTWPGQAIALDADAAQALAKRSNCLKCHAVDKKKDAASYKDVAKKYKGKADAQATLVKHITTGPKVKLEDGSQEEHPIVKTKNQDEIKNLVDWILSL
jgi:cytochrome c